MALLPLDGPAEQTVLSVTTTQVEAKVGTTAFSERKVVTLQPLDGKIRVFFKTGLANSSGLLVHKNQIISLEAADTQPIYIAAESGTVNVVVAERA